MEIKCEVMLSEKGKTLLVVNREKFGKCRTMASGKTYWRCTAKMCKAKLYTVGENKIVENELVHNHEVDSTLDRQKQREKKGC
jgi:hypothetical protein